MEATATLSNGTAGPNIGAWGARVRRRREDLSMTRATLAGKVLLSESSIRNIEQGFNRGARDKLDLICATLGIKLTPAIIEEWERQAWRERKHAQTYQRPQATPDGRGRPRKSKREKRLGKLIKAVMLETEETFASIGGLVDLSVWTVRGCLSGANSMAASKARQLAEHFDQDPDQWAAAAEHQYNETKKTRPDKPVRGRKPKAEIVDEPTNGAATLPAVVPSTAVAKIEVSDETGLSMVDAATLLAALTTLKPKQARKVIELVETFSE